MKLAEKFGLPVITLIDTPGAFPGIGAEERGQAQAIAVNLMEMSRLRVPIISIVIGEGGSGGALGIGVADRLAILEYAYYSVISPEGCAAILWRDGSQAPAAAEALKLRKAPPQLGPLDAVIPERLAVRIVTSTKLSTTSSSTLCRHCATSNEQKSTISLQSATRNCVRSVIPPRRSCAKNQPSPKNRRFRIGFRPQYSSTRPKNRCLKRPLRPRTEKPATRVCTAHTARNFVRSA